MKYFLIIVLVVCFVFNSCSPVRKEYFSGFKPLSSQVKSKERKKAVTENTSVTKETPQKVKYKNVMDTTYIYLNNTNPQPESLKIVTGKSDDEYNTAMSEFDNEKYESACARLNNLMKRTDSDEPLFFEIKYQLCECEMVKENFEEAEQMLSTLLSTKGLPENVTQKVMVSLGQVYCLQNKTRFAEEMFYRLKTRFPESQYLPFANCESAGKH